MIIPDATIPLLLGLAAWAGPTDHACNGRCAPEPALAAAPISTEWKADIREQMDSPATCTVLRDGAILYGTSYYAGGQRYDPKLRRVEGDWTACGWWETENGQMRGFVKLLACENWQPFSQPPLDHATAPITAPTYAPATRAPIITASAHNTFLGWGSGGASVAVDDDCGCLDTPAEMPPPVPLPAPFWTLMAALGGLWFLKWRTK